MKISPILLAPLLLFACIGKSSDDVLVVSCEYEVLEVLLPSEPSTNLGFSAEELMATLTPATATGLGDLIDFDDEQLELDLSIRVMPLEAKDVVRVLDYGSDSRCAEGVVMRISSSVHTEGTIGGWDVAFETTHGFSATSLETIEVTAGSTTSAAVESGFAAHYHELYVAEDKFLASSDPNTWKWSTGLGFGESWASALSSSTLGLEASTDEGDTIGVVLRYAAIVEAQP